MARWTGTWLTGPAAAGVQVGRGVRPGGRLGLPAQGPGSVASTGARVAAFAVDAVLSGLVARLLFPVRDPEHPGLSAGVAPVVVLAVVYLVGLTLVGRTLGMRLLRLGVVPVGRGGPAVGLLAAALRTALLLLLVPAVISDRDGRGLHDRAAGTVVVRTAPR